MSKTPEELYKERETRIMDAAHLKIPDRIPILVALTYFPAVYTGTPKKAAWYDHDKWFEASMKTFLDFQPDGIWSIQGFSPGSPILSWNCLSLSLNDGLAGDSMIIRSTRQLKLQV